MNNIFRLLIFTFWGLMSPYGTFAQVTLSDRVLSQADKKPSAYASFFFPNATNDRVINHDSLNVRGGRAASGAVGLLQADYRTFSNSAVSSDTVIPTLQNKLHDFVARHPVEKVHLHLDRSWYSLGDTIWFKAYTVTGAEHRLSAISGVLYAELINPGDTVIKRLTLQLHAGTSHGDFMIPYTYKSGLYRIRAYTNLMRNDSTGFYDHRIVIGGIPSVLSKTNEQAVPDIQFFPEGGYLVNGLRSKVAFKAISKNGLSASVQGVIIDNNNQELAVLSTQHAGMGEFPLTPEAGKRYKAKISCADGSTFTVDLPEARYNGFVLTLNNTADSVYVKIAASEARLKTDTVFYLLAQSGGQVSFTAAAKLNGPAFGRAIPKSRFHSGITRFTVFSQSGEPLNERILFIRNADSEKLAISGGKESYAPGEKVKLMLQADTGTFSIAITNETKAPADEQAESSIYSDILLTSELKGYIEDPDHYFADNSEQTRSDLDLLMLTQGYRRFEWKKIMADEPLKYQPETALNLSGMIKTMGNKPIANGKIRLTSVKDMFSADTLSDDQGRFIFSNLTFNDSTKLVINAKKAKGGTSVRIAVDKPGYLSVTHVTRSATFLTDSIPVKVSDALKQAYVTGKMLSMKNAIHLKEVTIRARRSPFEAPNTENMKLSANLNGPGNADQVLLSDQIMRSGDGKLSEILVGKVFGVSFHNGMAYNLRPAHSLGGSSAMVIIIEGAQVSPKMLDNINANDIYSIEILRSGGYLSIYGSSASSGALIVTLKHGAEAQHTTSDGVDGLIIHSFNGFYKAREFYMPKYNVQTGKQPNDDRSTIYWNPDIITTNGKASIEYYNEGSPATYRVVVEGIDGNGNLCRQVFKYPVGL